MKRPQLGFLLASVLLLATLLLLVGLGYIGASMRNYQSAVSAVAAAQARGLARAGLEDALQKLNKDRDFPPPASAQGAPQGAVPFPFVYSETMTDLDGVTPIGTYEVSIDTRFYSSAWQWTISPYQVVVVSSTGLVGPRSSPTAQTTYRLTLDVHNPDRVESGADSIHVVQDGVPCSSPSFWHQLRFEDLGSL